MSKYSSLTVKLTQLWEEISRFPIYQSDQAIKHFLEGTMPLLGATQSGWIAAARGKDYTGVPAVELLDQWFVVDSIVACIAGIDSQTTEENYRDYMLAREKNGGTTDPITQAVINHSGTTRSSIRSDFMADEEWGNHWINRDFHHKRDIGDVMHTVFNVDEDCESYIVFYRSRSAPPFSENEKEIAHMASVGAAALHQKLMRLRGVTQPNRRPLSSTEKSVLLLLLEGKRDTEISDSLKISPHTVKTHLRSVYRKFCVGGKNELMNRLV